MKVITGSPSNPTPSSPSSPSPSSFPSSTRKFKDKNSDDAFIKKIEEREVIVTYLLYLDKYLLHLICFEMIFQWSLCNIVCSYHYFYFFLFNWLFYSRSIAFLFFSTQISWRSFYSCHFSLFSIVFFPYDFNLLLNLKLNLNLNFTVYAGCRCPTCHISSCHRSTRTDTGRRCGVPRVQGGRLRHPRAEAFDPRYDQDCWGIHDSQWGWIGKRIGPNKGPLKRV